MSTLTNAGPELQNIPMSNTPEAQRRRAAVRDVLAKQMGFEIPTLNLICADYAALELRVMAQIHEKSAVFEALYSRRRGA